MNQAPSPIDFDALLEMLGGDKQIVASLLSKFVDELATDLAASEQAITCLLYTSPSPRDRTRSRMPSSA